jgi:hypothetical protein
MQMLERFSQNFQELGDKARQITEAVKMKVEVHYQLRDITEVFVEKSNIDISKDVAESVAHYEALQYSREAASKIKEEVYAFFEKVDKQLDLINMKMAFAGSKITELQESLRAQSHYKISLKKMLVYLLGHSSPDQQHWIQLPEKFPIRDMVQEKFRFRSLRYYDMGFLKRSKPFEQKTDIDYETEQRSKFELELANQALIQQNCEQAQKDLAYFKIFDLSKRLFEIMQQKDGIEIGVQTGYEFIRNLAKDTTIEIKEELQSNNNNSIQIWKVIIQSGPDLDS